MTKIGIIKINYIKIDKRRIEGSGLIFEILCLKMDKRSVDLRVMNFYGLFIFWGGFYICKDDIMIYVRNLLEHKTF